MRGQMRFFDYETIFIVSHGDPSLMLEAFKQNNTGHDFIVKPKTLVDSFWLSDRHKAEYLGLCSLRNYEDYLHRGEVNLSLDLVPNWIPMQVVKENPLVTLTDNYIIFQKEK